MGIKIYRDTAANSVVFSPSSVKNAFTNTLHAVEGDDGLVYIYDVYRHDLLEIASMPPTDVLDINGDMVSADLSNVVNYLNGQFAYSAYVPSGDTPTITSSLNESVVENNPFNYTITATNDPMFYMASGLPDGLAINHSTGTIFGSSDVVGVHPVTLTAINGYGTTTEILTLEVLAVGPGFVDTYSIHFKDIVYRQYLEIKTPAPTIEQSSGEPWSISFWLYAAKNAEYDLFSHGKDEKDTLYVKLISDTLEVGFRDADDDTKSMILRAGTVDKEVWYHICVTNAGTGFGQAAGVTVYIDAVAQVSNVLYDALTKTVGGSNEIRFGRASGKEAEASWYNGNLDEISYWDKELSAGEVTSIYNGGIPQDVSVLGISNLQSWWRMGDGADVFPDIYDVVGISDIKMTNMNVTNIINFTP